MEISESGFNAIDLSGCIFGNGWFNIFGVDPERHDTSTHYRRPVVDLKKRGLCSANDEQPQTTFRTVKDSALQLTKKFPATKNVSQALLVPQKEKSLFPLRECMNELDSTNIGGYDDTGSVLVKWSLGRRGINFMGEDESFKRGIEKFV
ncbi:hypothetical protein DL96DRAFT_1554550 [Flagelloscypha sp. PMI_526]|nr:hypothetical protein DL96DRAFT_1554550 [Flagelloscypha sp. PMI_526]